MERVVRKDTDKEVNPWESEEAGHEKAGTLPGKGHTWPEDSLFRELMEGRYD